MRLCSEDCIPCCDFCNHVEYKMGEINGKVVSLAPIACKLHPDEKHERIAVGCGFCEDYHCRAVED